MQNDMIISFHTNVPHKGDVTYYCKGKMYTEDEYWEMHRRKQQIKDVIQMIVFIAFLICRAYVFLEYGI